MRIYSEGDNFKSENFDILRFYDQTLLFTWQGDKIKVFNYNDPVKVLKPRLLLAPGEVKNVQSYSERIFITCNPCGVYKLSRDYQFAVLHYSAIGIGARFYQVITFRDRYLFLGDIPAHTLRLLFKHDPIDGAKLCMFGLIGENVEDELMSTLLEGSNGPRELCIFSRECEIYQITPNTVKILYNSPHLITDIIEVKRNGKINALLYITNRSTEILMYHKDDQLIFERIKLNHIVKTAYACYDKVLENIIWIVHSDGVKIYQSRKILGEQHIDITELSEKNITCLRNYNSDILGLNSSGELIPIDFKMESNTVNNENTDFVRLKSQMLEGTDSIVDEIYEKVKELQFFDNELIDQQNTLKRINMFACKQNLSTIPKLRVRKIAKKTFVNCEFGYGMPEKSQLSFSVKSDGRKIFATKRVTENETNIELPIPSSILSETSNITIDLVTLADEDYSWCISKNCIQDKGDTKVEAQISHEDKMNFINAKLSALDNLKTEDRIDIAKLNAIKNSVRKEFNVD